MTTPMQATNKQTFDINLHEAFASFDIDMKDMHDLRTQASKSS